MRIKQFLNEYKLAELLELLLLLSFFFFLVYVIGMLVLLYSLLNYRVQYSGHGGNKQFYNKKNKRQVVICSVMFLLLACV